MDNIENCQPPPGASATSCAPLTAQHSTNYPPTSLNLKKSKINNYKF